MAQQSSILPVSGVESIFEGGPPRRLTALARLPSPVAPNAGIRAMLAFGLAWIPLAVLVAIDIAWVIAAAQARRLLKSQRAMKIANRVSATTMAGAAAAIAAR